MDVYIGFDSAWTDNPKAPGAICAVEVEAGRPALLHVPRLAGFDQALIFIEEVRSRNGVTIVALDQPTLVPNLSGIRPVERVAASVVSWLGGGVQPANRGRTGMFCDASPIWRFLRKLDAIEDPELTREAKDGLHVMEVFPALALASMSDEFFGRLRAPKYNPARRKKFRLSDWVRVADAAAREANALGCRDLAEWCDTAGRIAQPLKSDQDMLDSALCVMIAMRWRLRHRDESILLGDLTGGYMVLPASAGVRGRLMEAARECGLLIDGVQPAQSTTPP